MDDQELERLLVDLESDRVERKPSLAEKDKICQAVCAFASDFPNHGKPGVVFVGVGDDGSSISDDGSSTGMRVTDELLLTLGGIRSDGNILPLPVLTVQKRALRASTWPW